VQAQVGRGTFVSETLSGWRSAARPLKAAQQALSRRGRAIAEHALRWQPPLNAVLPFRIGAPEVASFPFASWDRLARQLPLAERQAMAGYLDPAGWPALREAIAQWLWASRGLRCDASQVLVCSGSQQALDLVGRLLLDPGDEVMVEDPGYPGIRAALMAQGAVVRPVPVDDEGMCVEEGAARWSRAKLAVVTPGCQFPTGVRMGLARRLSLMAWAHACGGWVVEDDYDGEFQYGPHRIPAMAGQAQAERVLYAGTFSKTLHPGLRLGFLVLPSALVPAFAAARAAADRHAPGEQQAVLARFIADGHLLRHLNRMRELYVQRQAVLIRSMAQATQGAVRLQPLDHGMQLVHEIAAGAADHLVSAKAAELGVLLAPLSRYTIESRRRGWLFGYAGHEASALSAASRKVGPLLAAACQPPARTRAR
jgi:GntR family transcriptional regulator/MocR family aminotransferase